jgi:hypothetical protein
MKWGAPIIVSIGYWDACLDVELHFMSIIHGSSYAHIGGNLSPIHAVNLGGSVLSSQDFDYLQVFGPNGILESSLASVILD